MNLFSQPKLPMVFIFLFVLLIVSVPAFGDPDLIGHWTLDDGSGTAAVDSAGTNDGVLVGGPEWRSAGLIGGSVAFDGVDDLINLGLPDFGTPPTDLTDQMTLAFWIRADGFAISDARFISRANGTGEQDHLWMVSTINQTGLRFRLKTDGETTTLVSAAGLLQVNQWHHVTAVYDGLEMLLYLDGLIVARTAKLGDIDTDPTVGLALGNQPPGAGNKPWDGQLDDVRLYQRALQLEEIRSLVYLNANQDPIVEFTAQPTAGRPSLWVFFDALGSFDMDGVIVKYDWDFGDGTLGAGPLVSHIFSDVGDYLVYLTVTDDNGATAVDSLAISVWNTPIINIPFTYEVIDAEPPSYTHTKAVGDVDGDGLQDVLVAGARSGEGFFWYRNPSWERFTIVPPGVSGFTTDMTMGDVDGDGDLDAIIPKGYNIGAETFWYENPRPAGDPAAGPWTEHPIGVAGAHDVEAGDIDGNGLLDVMVRYNGTTLFLQVAPDTWTATFLSSRSAEGLDLVDLDNDDDLDAVINGHWLENPLPAGDPGLGAWNEHVIDTDWPDASRVHAADLNGDGHQDVIFAASEKSGERISWYETTDPVNGPWAEHLIAEVFDYVHSLEAADMDLDGDLDVIAAEMHQSVDPDQVTVFHNKGDGLAWSAQLVATTGSHNMVVTDLDADGDIDLVGANHALPPVEMWRNELNPNAQLDLNNWNRFVIEPDMPWNAIFVEPTFVDDDFLPDIVAGGWWYRNPGSAEGNWVRTALGLPLRNMAAVFDFDHDGDPDVLGTQGVGYQSNSDFAWAQNDGLGGFTIFENIASADGTFVQGTTVALFQPGGPLEVVLAWDDGTDTQMFTVPEDPTTDTWTWRVASGTTLGEEVDNGDIDRDGDLDILLGTKWLRNDDGVWTPFDLFPPTPPGEPDRVLLIDINLDGRLDALVGYGHDRPYGSLSWYEQPLVATDMWTEHVIDNPFKPVSIDIADMDLDGDMDIVMGEHNLLHPERSELQIYENLGGFGAGWRQHLIYTGDEHHVGTQLFDIERDGDLDIVSIGYTHKRMMIYENLSSYGQISATPDPDRQVPVSRLVLSAPYPNPFNPSTRLRYELPTATRVSLAVYDIRGRLVARLVEGTQAAGAHEVQFTPRGLASGVYLAHLQAGGQVRTIRMLLMK